MLHSILLFLAFETTGPVALTGVVLDERGRPAAGVVVEATLEISGNWVETASTTSGPAGRFELRQLLRTGNGRLPRVALAQARAVADQGRTSETARVARFPAHVTLRLRPGARLVARIVTESGTPNPDVRVRVFVERRSRLYTDRFTGAVCILEPGGRYDAISRYGDGRKELPCSNLIQGHYSDSFDLVPGEQQLTVLLDDGRVYRRRIVVRSGTWCEYRAIELAWRDEGLRERTRFERLAPEERVALATAMLPEAPRMEPRQCGDPPPRPPDPQPVADPVGPLPASAVVLPVLLAWLPVVLAALAAVLARRPAPLESGSTPRRGALAALAITAGVIGWATTHHGDAKSLALLLATVLGAVAVALAWGARGSARRAALTLAIAGGVLSVAGLSLLLLLIWALARAHRAPGPLDVVFVSGLLLVAGTGTAMLIAARRR